MGILNGIKSNNFLYTSYLQTNVIARNITSHLSFACIQRIISSLFTKFSQLWQGWKYKNECSIKRLYRRACKCARTLLYTSTASGYVSNMNWGKPCSTKFFKDDHKWHQQHHKWLYSSCFCHHLTFKVRTFSVHYNYGLFYKHSTGTAHQCH